MKMDVSKDPESESSGITECGIADDRSEFGQGNEVTGSRVRETSPRTSPHKPLFILLTYVYYVYKNTRLPIIKNYKLSR